MKYFIVVFVFLAFFCGSAKASTDLVDLSTLQNVRTTHSSVLEQAAFSADIWWAKQGHPLPMSPYLYKYDDPNPEVLAMGVLGGNSVYLNTGFLSDFTYFTTHGARKDRVWWYHLLWCTMAHERGHNLGFEHTTDGGLMGPDVWGDSCPGAAQIWAGSMVPLTKKHKK